MGDRGFDDEAERKKLRDRGIDPELAKRRTPTAVAWGYFAGWWSERSVGFTSSAGCGYVMIVGMTFIKGSVTWLKS
jgi:hypothetical protein